MGGAAFELGMVYFQPMRSHFSPSACASSVASICREEPVLLVYLFGSHARGTPDAESDLDIAILADASFSTAERSALPGAGVPA